VDFSLQTLGGVGDVPNYGGNDGDFNITSALENLGINLGAAAGSVGIAALGNKLGVSSAYTNPAAIAYNSSLLTRPPGSVSPIGAAFGVSGNAILFGGILLIGLVAFAAFRK